MRVIILCAGVGERLRPETYDTNKNLLDINGKTVIENLLDAFIYTGAHIECVHIIIGWYGYKFRKLLGSNYRGLKITFHENPLYKVTGAAHSLYLAETAMKNNPCVILEGDHYLHPDLLKNLLESPYENCILVDTDTSKLKYDEETIAYGMEGMLKHLEWKKQHSQDIKTTNPLGEALTIFKLSKQASNSLATILETHLLREGAAIKEIITPINTLINIHDIQYIPTNNLPWTEIDFPADLEKARMMKLD